MYYIVPTVCVWREVEYPTLVTRVCRMARLLNGLMAVVCRMAVWVSGVLPLARLWLFKACLIMSSFHFAKLTCGSIRRRKCFLVCQYRTRGALLLWSLGVCGLRCSLCTALPV
jgi:hypothetical protein